MKEGRKGRAGVNHRKRAPKVSKEKYKDKPAEERPKTKKVLGKLFLLHPINWTSHRSGLKKAPLQKHSRDHRKNETAAHSGSSYTSKQRNATSAKQSINQTIARGTPISFGRPLREMSNLQAKTDATTSLGPRQPTRCPQNLPIVAKESTLIGPTRPAPQLWFEKKKTKKTWEPVQ